MTLLDRVLRWLGLRRTDAPDPERAELVAAIEADLDAFLADELPPAVPTFTFRLALLGADGVEVPCKGGYAPRVVRQLPGPGGCIQWNNATVRASGCRVSHQGVELFQFRFPECQTINGIFTIVWPGTQWQARQPHE